MRLISFFAAIILAVESVNGYPTDSPSDHVFMRLEARNPPPKSPSNSPKSVQGQSDPVSSPSQRPTSRRRKPAKPESSALDRNKRTPSPEPSSTSKTGSPGVRLRPMKTPPTVRIQGMKRPASSMPDSSGKSSSSSSERSPEPKAASTNSDSTSGQLGVRRKSMKKSSSTSARVRKSPSIAAGPASPKSDSPASKSSSPGKDAIHPLILAQMQGYDEAGSERAKKRPRIDSANREMGPPPPRRPTNPQTGLALSVDEVERRRQIAEGKRPMTTEQRRQLEEDKDRQYQKAKQEALLEHHQAQLGKQEAPPKRHQSPPRQSLAQYNLPPPPAYISASPSRSRSTSPIELPSTPPSSRPLIQAVVPGQQAGPDPGWRGQVIKNMLSRPQGVAPNLPSGHGKGLAWNTEPSDTRISNSHPLYSSNAAVTQIDDLGANINFIPGTPGGATATHITSGEGHLVVHAHHSVNGVLTPHANTAGGCFDCYQNGVRIDRKLAPPGKTTPYQSHNTNLSAGPLSLHAYHGGASAGIDGQSYNA